MTQPMINFRPNVPLRRLLGLYALKTSTLKQCARRWRTDTDETRGVVRHMERMGWVYVVEETRENTHISGDFNTDIHVYLTEKGKAKCRDHKKAQDEAFDNLIRGVA